MSLCGESVGESLRSGSLALSSRIPDLPGSQRAHLEGVPGGGPRSKGPQFRGICAAQAPRRGTVIQDWGPSKVVLWRVLSSQGSPDGPLGGGGQAWTAGKGQARGLHTEGGAQCLPGQPAGGAGRAGGQALVLGGSRGRQERGSGASRSGRRTAGGAWSLADLSPALALALPLRPPRQRHADRAVSPLGTPCLGQPPGTTPGRLGGPWVGHL